MSKRVKPDHYEDAKKFAKKYMNDIKNNAKSSGVMETLAPDTETVPDMTLFRLKINYVELMVQMHEARGVLDIDSDDEEDVITETHGFEDGVREYLEDLGYFVGSVEFVIGKTDSDIAEEEKEWNVETEPSMRAVYVHPSAAMLQ